MEKVMMSLRGEAEVAGGHQRIDKPFLEPAFDVEPHVAAGLDRVGHSHADEQRFPR